MGRRLGLAAAMLGDPDVLILDEPVNDLDPEGIQWICGLMRSMAADGRTVLVSSHLMSEMQDTAEHLIVIGRGRLVAGLRRRTGDQRPDGRRPVRPDRHVRLRRDRGDWRVRHGYHRHHVHRRGTPHTSAVRQGPGRLGREFGPAHGTLPPLTGLSYFICVTVVAFAAVAPVNRRDA
jgi:ABC-type multidrug transport system ATPase subunit